MTFSKNLEQSSIGRNVDLAKVHFSQIIEASDSILVCASDVEETICMITLERSTDEVMSLFDKPSKPIHLWERRGLFQVKHSH